MFPTDAGHQVPPPAIDASDRLFAERYRAMSSKDTRFDGQFITGVSSTGIYCRPSCPALTPKPSNVTFYRTAAAAHEAGLRACKRCSPDAVPGSPEWNRYDDLAARAMRLIADGTVERDGVPGLARRLGYTTRHLHRVLVHELGAGPLALARAHRAQTARTLLTATDLPVADVAFAAGFSSIRQFNETIAAVYERTPSELRSAAGRAPASRTTSRPKALPSGDRGTANRPGAAVRTPSVVPVAAASTGSPVTSGTSASGAPVTSIRLRLPARAPFDGRGLMRFFADHAIAGVETGDATSYSRIVRMPNGLARILLSLDGPTTVLCSAELENIADLAPLVARARRMLDLDADSESIDEALSADAALATSVGKHPGVRLPGSIDIEETLFRTLVGQQISVAAARTVLGRLCADLCGMTGLFPTAAQIAERGREVLRGPATRIATILGVAEALASGSLDLDIGMPVEELTARLVALPGVGPWTAGYVAMRALGSPDVLLSTDLVLLRNAGALGLPPTSRALAEYSRRWAPWRSYAGLHLWRYAER